MTKRILITGGAGFIGSSFVNYIIKNYPKYYITVFDKLTYAGNKNSLTESFFDGGNERCVFTEACVTDRAKVAKAIMNSDIVIHFAAESKVIPKFITSLLQDRNIVLENSGVQTRDWLFVEDLCKAIDKALHLERPDIFGEVINIGSGKETSILTIATKIARLLNKNPDECFQYGRNRMGQVMSHMASTKKVKEILNWEPSIDIDKGLEITVEWYKSNRDWWTNLKFPVLKVTERWKI